LSVEKKLFNIVRFPLKEDREIIGFIGRKTEQPPEGHHEDQGEQRAKDTSRAGAGNGGTAKKDGEPTQSLQTGRN